MNYREHSIKCKVFMRLADLAGYDANIRELSKVTDLSLNLVYDLYKIAKDFTNFTIIFGAIAVIEFIVILFLIF